MNQLSRMLGAILEEAQATPEKLQHAFELPDMWHCWYLLCLTTVSVLCCGTLIFVIDQMFVLYMGGSFLTMPEGAVQSELHKLVLPRPVPQILQTLLAPALLEEAFWRVVLLPRLETLRQNPWWLLWVLASQSLYVGSHKWFMGPILSLLPCHRMRRPGASRTFADGRFLTFVLVMACILNLLFYGAGFVARTGTLYPCILVHWLTALVWQLGCHGNERLLYDDIQRLPVQQTLENKKISRDASVCHPGEDTEHLEQIQDITIPWAVRLCAFAAGHGLLFRPRSNTHIFLDCISIGFAMVCVILICARAVGYWYQPDLLLGVKVCLSGAYLTVALFVPISVQHAYSSEYVSCVEEVVERTQKLAAFQDLVRNSASIGEAGQTEVTLHQPVRSVSALRQTFLSECGNSIRNARWLGAREMLIGTVVGVATGVWMLSFYLGIAVPSMVQRFEISESELTPGVFLQSWACFLSVSCASMPLAVATRLAALEVLAEQVRVAELIPGFFGDAEVEGHAFAHDAPDSPRTPTSTALKIACQRYLRLHSRLKDISSHALRLFLSFNAILMTANILQGVAVWCGGDDSSIFALVSVAFMLLFLLAQAKVSSAAEHLKELAIKYAQVVEVDRFELSYIQLIDSCPAGWYVGPWRLGMSTLLTISIPFLSNVLLRCFSKLHPILRQYFTEEGTQHERALSEKGIETTLVDQVWRSLTIMPSWRELLPLGLASITVILALCLLAMKADFIQSSLRSPDGLRSWFGVARTLIAPCLIEEIFWRVLVLPAPSKTLADALPQIIYGTTLYVMSHVWPMAPILDALPGRARRPGAMAIFRDPVFVVMVVLLGVTLAALYYLSQGSIWPSVILHWLVVSTWLFGLQGDESMKDSPGKPAAWPSHWPKVMSSVALAVCLLGAASCYILALVSGAASGLPMVSQLLTQNPTKPILSICLEVSLTCFIGARSILALRMESQHRYLHSLGIFSLVCFGMSVASPACVEGRGWQRFMRLFSSFGCGVHVASALVSFVTGIADMWVVCYFNPHDGHELLRKVVRRVCSCVVVGQPFLRVLGAPVNPFCAIGEWLLLLGIGLHHWSLTGESSDAESDDSEDLSSFMG